MTFTRLTGRESFPLGERSFGREKPPHLASGGEPASRDCLFSPRAVMRGKDTPLPTPSSSEVCSRADSQHLDARDER
jgi:hypothetical protein